MRKKIVSAVLTAAMAASMLTACQSSKPAAETAAAATTATETTAGTTAATTAAETTTTAAETEAVEETYKIGIVTPTLTVSEDEFRAAAEMVQKYPDLVVHKTLPENFATDKEGCISVVTSLADRKSVV